MDITIEYIENGFGGAFVLPGARTEDDFRYAEHNGVDISAAKDASKKLVESARTQGLIKSKSFTIKPYTYGDRINASRLATNIVNGSPVLDNNVLTQELISASSGVAAKELAPLAPQIVDALWAEIRAITEPNPDRLLFLLQEPCIGPSQGQ